MEVTIFAKKRTTKEGKKFYTYLATLTKKDGSTVTTSVKFNDSCQAPRPESCPMNIIIEKGKCNLSTRNYVKPDTGDVIESHTLWINEYKNGTPYVDTSMDDFM